LCFIPDAHLILILILIVLHTNSLRKYSPEHRSSLH
jgi:hypothetical protein